MNVLKQKEFWMGFVLQASFLSGVLFWGADDVLDMLFIEASIPLETWTRVLYAFTSLWPSFLAQILTAYLAPPMKRWKFWVLVISSFFSGFGLAILLAQRVIAKYLPKVSGVRKGILFFLAALVFWWVLRQLISLFAFPGVILFANTLSRN